MILYSTGCPKCKILEKKLTQLNIEFEINTDESVMQAKGFTELPMLEIDDEVFNFMQAINWLNNK